MTQPHRTFAFLILGSLSAHIVAPLVAQTPTPAPAPPTTIVVQGRIVDMRGEGVPAAKVWVVAWLEPEAVLARTVADGEGFFRLDHVPRPGALEVRGTADGFCAGISPHRDDLPVTVTLQSSATVRGTLVDKAGKAVPDALVRAQLLMRRVLEVHCEGRTDAQGRFELRDVPMGRVRFASWVPAEGIAEATTHVGSDAEVSLQPGDAPTTSLSVTIGGLPDAPVTKVRLLLLAPVGTGLPPPLDRPTFTAATWSVDHVPDQDLTVTPIASGITFDPREARIKKGSGPHALRFTATPLDAAPTVCPAIVSGPDGKPLAGVALTLRAANDRGGTRCLSDAEGKLTLQTSLPRGSMAVVCSVDDRWVVDPRVDAKAATRRNSAQIEVTVDPDTTIALRLAPACAVQGQVLGTDGRPSILLRVELQELRAARNWLAVATTMSDREGSFEFRGLPAFPGPLRVNVLSERGTWTSGPLDLSKAGSNVNLAEARLLRPAIVEGVVRDADGKTTAGIGVRLAEWDEATQLPRGTPMEGITDRNGRYRFLAVPLGSLGLQLVGPGEPDPRTKADELVIVETGKTYTHDLQLPTK